MRTVTVTAFTDTGLVRSHNEDALLVAGWMCQSAAGALVTMQIDQDKPLVCAVADGMGGHAGGDLASRIALGVIADSAQSWRTSADVTAALVEANERVRSSSANPELRGMGTTIAGVCIQADEVIVFNVGDSRVYTINNGFLQQVSVDDAVLDTGGRPTNVITQSLGQSNPVNPHVHSSARDGATYLICSDGVSGGLSPAGLRTAALQPNSWQCATSIIDSTRANGAEDNFSLILVDVPAVAPRTEADTAQTEIAVDVPDSGASPPIPDNEQLAPVTRPEPQGEHP
jgi:protein phosphatase